MKVFAIDPGPTKSGWCLIEDGAPTDWGWSKNLNLGASVRKFVEYDKNPWSHVVIEDVGNYGMAVGRDTFETVKWIGRFDPFNVATMIPRPTIKTHLCGVASAKDSNVRQALIDRFGGDEVAVGGKKCQTCKGKGWKGTGRPVCPECDGDKYETPPGGLHGISGHAWSALAVGVTYLDQAKEIK